MHVDERTNQRARQLPATSAGARAPDLLSAEQWSRLVRALGLTQREAGLLRAACYDERQRAIADDLGIAEYTVHTHWHNIFSKLGVHSVASALSVVFAAHLELSGQGNVDADTTARRPDRNLTVRSLQVLAAQPHRAAAAPAG